MQDVGANAGDFDDDDGGGLVSNASLLVLFLSINVVGAAPMLHFSLKFVSFDRIH